MMGKLFLIGLAGFVGTLGRYGLSGMVAKRYGETFPLGTLALRREQEQMRPQRLAKCSFLHAAKATQDSRRRFRRDPQEQSRVSTLQLAYGCNPLNYFTSSQLFPAHSEQITCKGSSN